MSLRELPWSPPTMPRSTSPAQAPRWSFPLGLFQIPEFSFHWEKTVSTCLLVTSWKWCPRLRLEARAEEICLDTDVPWQDLVENPVSSLKTCGVLGRVVSGNLLFSIHWPPFLMSWNAHLCWLLLLVTRLLVMSSKGAHFTCKSNAGSTAN